MLQIYINSANIKDDCNRYIFRALTFCKKDNYSQEVLPNMLESNGLNNKFFGLHILRPGGATTASYMGIPDRLFKRHGRKNIFS
jgi:hypothetical protein